MRISDWSSDVCSSDLASTSSARTDRRMAMFVPLTRPGLGAASPGARLYCRPVCFVDRPHELDDAGLRLADTMLWFAAWHLSLRDGDAVRSALVPVPELDDWIAAMPARPSRAEERRVRTQR